jgi:glycosyltransferase involved in cell wall biosynthesis
MQDFERVLCVYTKHYPFSKFENHTHNEIRVLAKYFKDIYVFPKYTEGEQRELPKNVHVCSKVTSASYQQFDLKIFFSFITCFIYNIFQRNIFQRIKYIFSDFKYIYCKFKETHLLRKYLVKNKLEKAIHYSVWMDDWALNLALLKQSGYIDSFVCRAHGYDMYDFRHSGNYVPFQEYIFLNTSKVACVSEAGYNYLLAKYQDGYKKLELFRLGVFSNGISPAPKNKILIVTACNINDVKRVYLILESLALVKCNVEWYHFGDGPLMEEMVVKSKSLPDNIKVKFYGRVSNEELFEFYKNFPVTFFLLVSKTEGGVPVSIQEAMSFGIPVIATNVGGIPEIVNSSNGMILDVNFSPTDLAKIIDSIGPSYISSSECRESAFLTWESNYNAERNFSKYAEFLLNEF